MRDTQFLPRLDLNHTMPAVGVDFESYYDKKISIRTMGSYAYLTHPDVDIYLVTIYDGEQLYVGRPEEFDWSSLDGRLLVSHNSAFDKMVHDLLVLCGVITGCQFAEWNCTGNLAAYLRVPRDLKGAIKTLYGGYRIDKNYRKLAEGKQAADMVAEGTWDNIVEAAIEDAKWTWQLWTDFSPQWPALERRLSVMTTEQCHRGLPIDYNLVMAGIATMADQKIHSAAELPWVKDPLAESGVLSVIDLQHTCREAGIEAPSSVSEDSRECIAWENKYAQFPWISEMRNWRKCNIKQKRLETIASRLTPDYRFPYAIKYFGAHTGRWSGGGRGSTEETGVNVQNFQKEPLHGVDERKCIVASKGRRLIICDAAQIEPRCLTWLSQDWDKLELIRQGMSVYEVHARGTMGWIGGEMKKEAKRLYQLAKIRVLGLGYGCGHVKFQAFAETQYQYHMTLIESNQQVKDFRKKETKITDLWEKLQSDFYQAVEEPSFVQTPLGPQPAYILELPSGRQMIYFNPMRAMRKDVKPRAKKKKDGPAPGHGAIGTVVQTAAQRYGLQDPASFRMEVCASVELGRKGHTFFYGGLLAENLTQATARDAFGEAMVRVEDEFGIYAPILFHSHDELIMDADPGVSVREVEEVMSIAPAWMSDCPFGAEGSESYHYLK